MPLIARQRSRLAVLAVLALVGSLLAISAVPAVAAPDEKVSAGAEFSACVAAATEDAGFTDMDGNFARDEANCLAHYAITTGTSEGVFSPNDTISRRQMALFLARAAGPVGIDLGDSEDQGFSDIAGESDAIQNAINQVASAEIMEGSGSLFNPTGGVSRQDMAVFLDAFLTEAGIELDRKAPIPYNVDEDDIDTPFNDLGRVTFAAYSAINRLYELGVANGTGDGSTFSPDALLSRAQMAVFITRALGHTDARPAGLSIQVAPAAAYDDDTPSVQAALRDSDHQPIADALVEVFSAQSHVDAFNDEGECVTDLKDEALGSIGAVRCEIDAADEATEPDGNVLLDLDGGEFCLGNTTLWVWTGDIGDEFNLDETDSESTPVQIDPAPDDVEVESDKAGNARFLEYGDTVTFEVQVIDESLNPVPVEGLVLMIRVAQSHMGATAFSTVADDYTTDAHGRVELNYIFEDPKPGDDRQGEWSSVVVEVTDVQNADGTDYSRIKDPTGRSNVDWSDRDSVPWDLTISQSVAYHEVSDEGSGVRHTVRATLVDQYGDPLPNEKVRFWSSAANGNETLGPDPIPGDDGLGGVIRHTSATIVEDSPLSVGDRVNPDDLDDLDEHTNATIVADSDLEVGDPILLNQKAQPTVGFGTVDDYADERSTNRRGVATKSYSRDAEEAYAEVIVVAFNHNPDDGDDDMDENEDPADMPDFDDVGTTATASEAVGDVDAEYDPYYVEGTMDFGARALDLTDSTIHYWAVKADDNLDSDDFPDAGLGLVAANVDSNLVVVSTYITFDEADNLDFSDGALFATTDKIWIGIYDSNDQFNTGPVDGPFRVTMSYFESTLYDEPDPDLLDHGELLHFVIEEEPLDEVNRFTNVSEGEPSAAGRCVAE